MPNQGVEEWDREGGVAHDPQAFSEFLEEMRTVFTQPVRFEEIDCHINDDAFADKALQIFDAWLDNGTIKSA